LADPQGRLAEVATRLNNAPSNPNTQTPPQDPPVKEEDPELWSMARKSFKVGSRPDQANTSRNALPVYPASLRSVSPTESHLVKPLPPRFSLKSGDDTASGAVQPIIDEIASALREWHALMFHYLACRDYKLFHLVREHIEALHFGRRQLLVQTLSSEETTSLRRECVVRLVGGNIIQGLDVIVRHPAWGALVTVDVEGEVDPRSWVSPVRMYAMQVALAYMNPLSSPSLSKASLTTAFDLPTPFGSLPSPLTPNPSDSTRLRGTPRGHGSFSIPAPTPSGKARFYHVYLDVRAFVASPCSPGEWAELYFSLYNEGDSKFLTEEFCVHLNHNGVLARDPTARIKTLFTDLVQSDVQGPIYLVCRIVRNGAMKIGSSPGSDIANGRRGSDVSFRDGPDRTSTSWDPSMSSLTLPAGGRRIPTGENISHRRPFGCAVLELTQLTQLAQENLDISATREHSMPIYVPTNETIFSVLHQDIIVGNNKEYEKSPRYSWCSATVLLSLTLRY
jgi:dedicator of cytokinesis protein 3